MAASHTARPSNYNALHDLTLSAAAAARTYLSLSVLFVKKPSSCSVRIKLVDVVVVSLGRCHSTLASPQQALPRIHQGAHPLLLATHITIDLERRRPHPTRVVVDIDVFPLLRWDLVSFVHDAEHAALLSIPLAHNLRVPIVPRLAVHATGRMRKFVQPLVGAKVHHDHDLVARVTLDTKVAVGAEVVVLVAVVIEFLNHPLKIVANRPDVGVEGAEGVVTAGCELDHDDRLLRGRRAAWELRTGLPLDHVRHLRVGADALQDEKRVDQARSEIEDGWQNGITCGEEQPERRLQESADGDPCRQRESITDKLSQTVS